MAKRELGPAALQVAQAVRAVTAQRFRLVGPTGFVVACSGGADSLALAAAAAWVARKDAVDVQALIVDHGLQEGSSLVAYQAASACESVGLAAKVQAVQVVDSGQGPEAAARDARYRALLDHAGSGYVLLGHTLDDQAETVLLGLARGSGTRSLAGMSQVRDQLLRPLLSLRRATTTQACQEWGLNPWHDPHNDCSDYTRVRVRQQVLPVLEQELGPGVAEALARTSDLARDDADFLDSLAARVPLTQRMNALDLAELPAALRRRVLRRWLIERGVVAPELSHVLAVEALVTSWRGQRGVDLPQAIVTRIDGMLHTDFR